MKWGKRLAEHLASCELCDKNNYVDYYRLKTAVRDEMPLNDFQVLWRAEADKFVAALAAGEATVIDEKFIEMNQISLDKASKKYDKYLSTRIRASHWDTQRELVLSLGDLDLVTFDSSTVPPDYGQAPRPTKPSNTTILLAGACSGIASRTLTAPLDRIKIILQAGNPAPSARPSPLEVRGGAWQRLTQAAKAIVRDAGIRGFWQGNLANVLKVMPESACKFLLYDICVGVLKSDDGNLSIAQRLTAGSIAGAVSQAVVYPLDVTKTRLALAPKSTYSGILGCLTSTARNEGFAALYKGLTPALVSIVPAAGIDLAVYNTLRDTYLDKRWSKRQELDPTLKRYRSPGEVEIPIFVALGFGAVSATCGAVVAYPLTLIRTRLIAQGMPERPVEYSGPVHCARELVSKSGFGALYRGLIPALLKTIPAVSIGYGTFEAAKFVGGAK